MIFFALAMLTAANSARAEGAPIAPSASLALPIAHRIAEDELRRLVHALPIASQRRMTGVYVAFDASSPDVDALAACDDDGDYVIVLGDPLLITLDFVAQAAATDETFKTRKLEEYGVFLAREQRQGTRLLPPAPGFFDRDEALDPSKIALEHARFNDAVAGVLAHELAHLTGDATACDAPTATHEQADEVWTAAERAQAHLRARPLYSAARAVSADRDGATILFESGHGEEGYVAWLSLLDAIERVPAAARRDASTPTYLVRHPQAGLRRDAFRAIADAWRAQRKIPHA